jgi:pimeloyl-ACP methyl ester carboxylesterase
MALTLRGYRPSSGQVDWSQAQDDALSGIDSILTLPGVTRVALLGVGRSSTAAMLACAQHSECAAIILVNPIPDEASSPLEQASTTIGDRPLLMLVSQERADAQQNAQIIQASAGASGAIQVFPALTVDQLVTITPLADWLFQSLGVAIPSGN